MNCGRGISQFLRRTVAAGLVSGSMLIAGAAVAQAQNYQITGSCIGFDLSRDVQSEENPAGEGRTVLALYDGVPLYADASASTPAGTLRLGDVVVAVEDGDYLGVRPLSESRETLRYVYRGDIGCENRPLNSAASGLERKAVIKTDTVRSDDEQGRTVSAYRTPALNDCTENCRKLSRFELYFVFAETENALLLAREVRVATNANTPLVGWIAKEDIYEWPYSIAARVREDYVFNDGYGSICGYLSLEEAREADPDKCQPILGGPSWFNTSTRLLVLQQHPLVAGGSTLNTEQVIFETIAPITSRDASSVTASGGTLTAGAGGDYIVDPESLRGASTDVLLKNNRIDLFFLIDGTKSMLPHIDSIRGRNGEDGLIQVMLNGFQQQIASGVRFRAGFRVFRDTNRPDRNSLGESFVLPDQDCALMSAEDTEANLAEFARAIETVNVSTDDQDDYPEDLYGGLAQALRDMGGCPENRKLVFIITDAGYDEKAQAARGVAIPDINRLAERFNDEYPGGAVFFVRPPLDTSVRNQKYMDAYDDLIEQAQRLLPKLNIVRELVESGEAADFFFQLRGDQADGASIVGEITQNIIRKNVAPEVVDNLIIDIRGGASLQQAIERLKRENRDIPAYFWRLVERGACEDLGEACSNATYQSVTKVYFANDPKAVALDVWMNIEQLKAWNDLLTRATSHDQAVAEHRQSAVSAIDDAIRTVIREPPYNDENEPFGEYLERAKKLPIGFLTPLLGYSMADLIRPDRVSACELLALMTWLDASRQMMKIAESGLRLPDYVVSEGPGGCPQMTDAGRRIRNPASTIGEKPLEGGGSLKSDAAQNSLAVTTYWLPQKYLP